MKKFLFLLITVIYSYGVYSIQLYTSINIKYAKIYFDKLPQNIKNKSFIYLTDSGYYTVRYLVAKHIKTLKPSNIKHYSIVKDDINKIKKINTPYIHKMLLKLQIIIPKQSTIIKPSKPSKHITKQIKKTKQLTKLPDWVKMNITLKNNNLYEVRKLLNKKIDIYQKIAALQALKKEKELISTIFEYENITNDQNLYNTYFNLISKKYISFESIFENKGSYNNILNTIQYKNSYLLEINYDNIYHKQNKEISIAYKNIKLGLRDNNATFVSLKGYTNFKLNKINFKLIAGIFQNSLDNDQIFNTTINHFISLDTSFQSHKNYMDLISTFSKYYTQNNHFMFDKYEITLNDIYNYNSLLNLSSYIKQIQYSNILDSYTEIGIGAFYGYSINHLKTPKFFINPIITYNTSSNIGYNLSIGMNKRVIKADNLKIILSISKDKYSDTAKILFNYIYY